MWKETGMFFGWVLFVCLFEVPDYLIPIDSEDFQELRDF